jgi:hypothetical protein
MDGGQPTLRLSLAYQQAGIITSRVGRRPLDKPQARFREPPAFARLIRQTGCKVVLVEVGFDQPETKDNAGGKHPIGNRAVRSPDRNLSEASRNAVRKNL